MKHLYTIFTFFILFYSVSAQTYQVEMVSNLNLNGASNPRWLTECNGSLYFFASDGINGHKIFSVYGNGIPTICPNISGAAVFGDGTTSTNLPMGVLNNNLYIPILGPSIGRELYKYDAVNIPTIVLDINPGNGSGSPNFLTEYNGKLYFQANAPTTGTELWVHDPVGMTTQCLTDINPGALSSSISFITVFNNKLYFAGTNGNDTTMGNTGIELYCFDPALNSVSLIADINPGYIGSNPTAMSVANNKLYFVASEPIYGKELYEFDGTNVTRLTDVNPGPAQGLYTSDQSYPTFYNNKIYFAANEANNDINLGVYDIASNTSSIIYCAGPGLSGIPRYFKVWDGKLFFSSYTDTSGIELWAVDSSNTPYQVWDINPGVNASYPKFFTEYNGNLYFNAYNDTSSAEELFKLSKKVVVNPNAISENGATFQLKISPNPVRNTITITAHLSTSTILSFQLLDVFGRTLYQTEKLVSNEFKIDIDCSGLLAGSYFLRIKDQKGTIVHVEKVHKIS